MARNTLKDPLEAAKLAADGKHVDSKDPKAQAAELLALVKRTFPEGLPAASPFAGVSVDEMLQSANKAGMPFGPFYSPDELRLVMHYGHVQLAKAPVASQPVGATLREPAPEVPMQPPAAPKAPRRKAPARRTVPPSKIGEWIVINERPLKVSAGGQIFNLRPGARLRRKDYEPGGAAAIEAMVDQGVELEAVDADEAEEA